MKVMPAPLGGIGQQVADNLFELGKSTAQSTVKTAGDLVGGIFEQLSSSSSGVSANQGDTQKNPDQIEKDRQEALAKQKDKQQYDRVLSELEQYRERRKQLDAQIAQEKQQEEQQRVQKEAQEKQEKQNFVQMLLSRVGAGSHGETDRQKE